MAIPSETKTWLDIASTTIENYRPMFWDQITDAIPLIKIIRQRDSVTLDGGDGIVETVMYALNNTVGSYSGYDLLDLTPQETFTTAKDDWKDIAGSVTFSQDDIDRNRGKAQMKNLLQGRIKNLRLSYQSSLNTMLYRDGTGNSSKDILGLLALVADSSTNTVHDISGAAESWWRNVSYAYDTCTADTAPGYFGAQQGGTLNTYSIRNVLSSTLPADNFDTTFLFSLDHVFDEVTFGDTGPHIGVCTYKVYQRLKHSMYQNKRFDMEDTGRADPGFRHVNFNGIPVVFDRAIPSTTHGTSTQDGRMYFLNMDFMRFYIHSMQNFRTTDIKELLPRQNAFSLLMFLKAQWMIQKRNACAVLHSIWA